MIVGIDLDNTIINYQNSFKQIAKSENIKINKNLIKEKLKTIIEQRSKDQWTIIQGEVYGKKINRAKLFKDFKKFFNFAINNKIRLVIISHKTKFPILGEKKNLHDLAKKFLKRKINNNYFKENKNLFFETSLEKKINRIRNEECDFFIDDLKKIFTNYKFPLYTEGLLYNSNKDENLKNFSNWKEIIFFFKEKLKEKKILGGKNNITFTLKNKSIFVKKFQNNFDRELIFNNFLKLNNIYNIPKILNFSKKNKVIKYQFYPNIKKKIINKNNIIKIFKFIKNINNLNFSKKNFKYAKDFCKNLKNYDKELKTRIQKHKRNVNYNKNLEFKNLINKIEKKYNLLKENNYFSNSYLFKEKDLILSPCDFHLDNMIFDYKIIYVDFEYSGLDDPAKLYSVFFLQPNFYIKKNIFDSVINKILFFQNKDLIKKRIIYLFPIIYLRWALILLNNFSKSQFIKTKQYLKLREDYYNIYKSNLLLKN